MDVDVPFLLLLKFHQGLQLSKQFSKTDGDETKIPGDNYDIAKNEQTRTSILCVFQ